MDAQKMRAAQIVYGRSLSNMSLVSSTIYDTSLPFHPFFPPVRPSGDPDADRKYAETVETVMVQPRLHSQWGFYREDASAPQDELLLSGWPEDKATDWRFLGCKDAAWVEFPTGVLYLATRVDEEQIADPAVSRALTMDYARDLKAWWPEWFAEKYKLPENAKPAN
jgi:hypothetical protein